MGNIIVSGDTMLIEHEASNLTLCYEPGWNGRWLLSHVTPTVIGKATDIAALIGEVADEKFDQWGSARFSEWQADQRREAADARAEARELERGAA